MKAMDNNQKDRIMNKFIYLLACTLFVSCQNNNKSSVTQMEVELDSMLVYTVDAWTWQWSDRR